jgi:transposase
VDQHSRLFIGLDVSKLKISVAVADGERGGEVRFLGDIPSDPASVSSIVQKLAKRGAKLYFCYEAGPTGYELYRQLTEMGHDWSRRSSEDQPARRGQLGTVTSCG